MTSSDLLKLSSTKDVTVPKLLVDQIIGQEKAAELIRKAAIQKRNVLLVLPKNGEFENLYRAARNLSGVSILNANMLNAYQVLDNKLILLVKEAIPVIEETFLKK